MPKKNDKISVKSYHDTARDVSKKLDTFLLSEFQKRDNANLLLSMYRKFIERKMGKEHQRPMLVYIASQLFGLETDKNYSNLLPLMATTELAIWSAYALNWVTDGKNQESQNEVMIDLVASQYLWTEILFLNLPDKVIRSYIEMFRKMMRSFLLVETDLTITNYDNLMDENKFWKAYNLHGTQGTGILDSYCFQIVDQYFDLKIPSDKMQKLDRIIQVFGRNLQIINDTSDLMIPNPELTTSEKRPIKDYFVDIRTNRLTYPIWLLLNKSKKENLKLHEEILESAQKRQYRQGFMERVFSFIKESGLMNEIVSFLKKEEERMKKEVDSLGVKNRGSDLLKILSIVVAHNKFLVQIKKDYDLYGRAASGDAIGASR